MKHTKITALLCAMVLSGFVPSFAAPPAGDTPLDPYRAAVEKMKELEQAKENGPAKTESLSQNEITVREVNYTDALLRGLDLTVADVQASVEAGTFKNLSPEAPAPEMPEPEYMPEPEMTPEPELEPAEEEMTEETPVIKKVNVEQGESANIIDMDGDYNDSIYISGNENENALRVPMAYITAKNAKITKSGDSTQTESSELYGLNAALLATHGGRASLTGADISSEGTGASGAYGYAKSTYINLTDSKVRTAGNHAAGVSISMRAMMKTVNTEVSTSGDFSPAIAVRDGGGIFIAENGTFSTTGLHSHGIYSKGDVTITDTKVIAGRTKAAVLKGNNTITLVNSTLQGNEISDMTPHNIVLFSKEDDIGTMGTQYIDAKNSTLVSKKGDMFYVTATHGKIHLSETTLVKDDPKAPLITITGNDGADGWGTPGSNGGHLELICDNQTLSGDIIVDSISNINLNLRNNSTYTGAIKIVPNAENGTPYKANADVFIAAGSTWNLTGDTELTSLYNLGKINYNGYTITLADGTVMKE